MARPRPSSTLYADRAGPSPPHKLDDHNKKRTQPDEQTGPWARELQKVLDDYETLGWVRRAKLQKKEEKAVRALNLPEAACYTYYLVGDREMPERHLTPQHPLGPHTWLPRCSRR